MTIIFSSYSLSRACSHWRCGLKTTLRLVFKREIMRMHESTNSLPERQFACPALPADSLKPESQQWLDLVSGRVLGSPKTKKKGFQSWSAGFKTRTAANHHSHYELFPGTFCTFPPWPSCHHLSSSEQPSAHPPSRLRENKCFHGHAVVSVVMCWNSQYIRLAVATTN